MKLLRIGEPTAQVLPFRFAAVARAVLDRLAELAGRDGDRSELSHAMVLAEQLHAAAERFDTDANAARQDGATEEQAHVLNHTMMRLSRCLIPMMSTVKGRYGHDPYGLTAQTTLIPSLWLIEKRKTARGPDRWMLDTAICRQTNRVSDTLREANELLRHWSA